MSIRTIIERTIRKNLQLGHVAWPTFGMQVRIGDAARDGRQGFEFSGLGNLLDRFGLSESEYQPMESVPSVDIEFSDGVQRQGSLSAQLGAQAANASVDLHFESERSFYLFVPKARIRAILDVDAFAHALHMASTAGGHRIPVRERIVYKTISAEGEGVLLLSRSRGATARIRGDFAPRGSGALRLETSSGQLTQLRTSADSAVFAFSVFRLALGRREYVIDPLD